MVMFSTGRGATSRSSGKIVVVASVVVVAAV